MTYQTNKYKTHIIFFICLSTSLLAFLSIPLPLLHAPEFQTQSEELVFREKTRRLELAALDKRIERKQNEIESLKDSFYKSLHQKPFLVVNTATNEIKLIQAGQIIHRSHCSTGSYILLKAKGERQWLFRTPKGSYRVSVKLVDPWWYKPDWAYVEEGLPIPSKYSRKRYQGGVLGDYALGFGNGYLIHGTLYKRFLGLPVTHGCVRLDDEDMKLVFNTLTHGSRIYIY